VKKILSSHADDAAPTAQTELPPAKTPPPSAPPVIERNSPLLDSDDEKVREFATLDQKFVIDVAKMPPASASCVCRHPCLTPEALTKWRVGFLPMDDGDKRGFSIRGQIIYPVLAEDRKVLHWVGRDPNYERKERNFARFSLAERAVGSAPIKHRFQKGFHRGQELFGHHSSR